MRFNPPKRFSKLILMVTAFVIVSLILWNTNSFFRKFKEEERYKMEIWATAQSELLSSPENQELGNIYLKVLQNNTSTPMLMATTVAGLRSDHFNEGK